MKRTQSTATIEKSVERMARMIQVIEIATKEDVRDQGHHDVSVGDQDLAKTDEKDQGPQEGIEIKTEIATGEIVIEATVTRAIATRTEVTVTRTEETKTETRIGREDTEIEMTTVSLVEMKEMTVAVAKTVPHQGDVLVKTSVKRWCECQVKRDAL